MLNQDPTKLRALKSQVLDTLSILPDSEEQLSQEDRHTALQALKALQEALEPPELLVRKLVFGPHSLTASQIAISMGIFNAFDKSGFVLLNSSQIAEITGSDQVLVVRIMRMLISNNMFVQTEDGRYQPLQVARMIATDPAIAGTITHFYQQMPVFAEMDSYFRKTNFKNPEEPMDCPFQYAMRTQEHVFTYLAARPEMQKPFNDAMAGTENFREQDWYEYFPVQQKLIEESSDKDVPRLVEIGGGTGRSIASALLHHPQLQGRVVLQELPSVVSKITEPLAGVEIQAQDMFEFQPIRGARAYLFRSVLHDFPDKMATKALQNVWEVMNGSSILLIHETVMAEIGAPGFSAHIDMTMMAAFASLERTEKQWVSLLQSAGFQVVHIWKSLSDRDSVSSALFEAIKKT